MFGAIKNCAIGNIIIILRLQKHVVSYILYDMKQYEDFVVPEYTLLMCTFYHNTDLILNQPCKTFLLTLLFDSIKWFYLYIHSIGKKMIKGTQKPVETTNSVLFIIFLHLKKLFWFKKLFGLVLVPIIWR